MANFNRGAATLPQGAGLFDAGLLDDETKKQLCLDLLAEIGAQNIRQPTARGEIVHSCPVPDAHAHGDRNPSASLNYKKLAFHCLTGDTLVKTYDGEVPIAKLAGQTVRLLDGNGKWVDAPVKHYGRDRIYRVTMSRNGVQRVVETTGEHRWYIRPKGRESRLVETTTVQLKPRQRIPSVWAMTRTGRTGLSPIGIMAGFVYGDGQQTEHGARANFFGAKDAAMLPHFAGHEVKHYSDRSVITRGLPRSWKSLPSLNEGASYLWGWLAGYFAADGCVADDGHITLSCASEETLRFIVALCDRLGVATYSLSTKTRVGIHGREGQLSALSFRNSTLTPEFFLIPAHRVRFEEAKERRRYERTHWWVVSVEETDRIEDVYCAEVPTTQSFVLAGNVLTGNCLGCGARGGMLWFIALVRGEHDHTAARAWLGEQTGLDGHVLDKTKILEQLDAIFNRQALRAEEMPVYPDSTMDPWTWDNVHPYMTDEATYGDITCRGIPEENCRRFGIGYAEHYPMGYERDEAGAVLRDYDGSPVPRDPQERIIIPIRWEGRLVGWQARAIRPQDAHPEKYRNSVGCPRNRIIYGWDGPNLDQVLVESPMSVLRHCHHQPMIASFGKVVTDEQVRILQRARSLTVWFDPDPGGWEGTERLLGALTRYVPVRVVEFPYRGKDPADLPDDVVDRFVKTAVPWSLWQRPTALTEWKEG
jgi:DNA primase